MNKNLLIESMPKRNLEVKIVDLFNDIRKEELTVQESTN